MKGYFGIGVYHSKTEVNIGTLWRSAFQLDASFIFTIGKRYKKQCSDTYNTHNQIPLYHYFDFDDFKNHVPYDCQIVCIEFSDIKLNNFEHPKKCIYLLGAEDNGIPKVIYEKYKTVEIPAINQLSYNVAVAGSIVMYDRLIKRRH